MNRAYRLVWSHIQNRLVVAAEISSGRGKNGSKSAVALSVALLGSLAVATPAMALSSKKLPTGGTVVSGQASISQQAARMDIKQQTDKAIINWQSFSIGKKAQVNFAQPSSSSVALNRVISSNPSKIYGKLNANGQVYLINPNGIVFGSKSQVNVGGLIASTLDITNQDFLNGKRTFTRGNAKGGISNKGKLNGSTVALIAPRVVNKGIVTAQMGNVVLASGNKVTLSDGDSGLITVAVDPSTVKSFVKNNNLIVADGGQVIMTAMAAGTLKGSIVNSGTLQAKSLKKSNGRILLSGGANDTVKHSGTLTVSSKKASGGEVKIQAKNINLAKDSSINASASKKGDGGKVVIAGTGTTKIQGHISAKSTKDGGQGGQIETSGYKLKIASSARVSTKASKGTLGTWQLQSSGFKISKKGNIKGTVLNKALKSTNVTIKTTGANGKGDIQVSNKLKWTSGQQLALSAWRNINIKKPIKANAGNGKLALEYGQGSDDGKIFGTTASYSVLAPINLASGGAFTTKLGKTGTLIKYTIITALGDPGSTTGTDLQGINGNLSGHYVLGSNIDASATSGWNGGEGFEPIGNYANRFTGTFDGQGYVINGLTIDRSTKTYVGLFGYTDGASIRNIGLDSLNIKGQGVVGGLVGNNNNSSIHNSTASGSVTGTSAWVGGLVGENWSSNISNSSASGDVTGTGDHVGGLVGWNHNSSINNSTANSNVTGSSNVGGLVGRSDNVSINNSTASGNVTGTGEYSAVGGLVGLTFTNSSINNSTASGDVAGDWYVGGLVGYNGDSSSIDNSTASGDVTGNKYVGGLVGMNYNYSSISNSYASGNVTGTGSYTYTGGLVGGNDYHSSISNSYAIGKVTGGKYAGGLVGLNYDYNSSISNSVWDINTTGQTKGCGEGNCFGATGNTKGGTGGTVMIWLVEDGVARPFYIQ